ncbi:DUF6301 family protein [Nocardia sp. NPDC004068]|uniref:DUF6301 family protein n=1 Tax=Nocardia sp. NPDC004068 TaxID=3364303 RepID=UPI0036C28B00
MNLLQRQLTLVLHGSLDQAALDKLVESLGLRLVGTFADPVGSELARRTERHPKYRTITALNLSLTRSGSDEWTLGLDAVPGTDIAKWQGLAELGCRAAGLTVADRQRRLPGAPVVVVAQNFSLPAPIPSSSEANVQAAEPRLEGVALPLDPRIYSIPDSAPMQTTPFTEERRQADAFIDRLWPEGMSKGLSADQLGSGQRIATLMEHQEANPPKRFSDPPVRAGWPALDDDEIIKLARQLRNLVWSWRMDDALGLAGALGWITKTTDIDHNIIDTRLGTADGYVLGEWPQADCLCVPVTGPASEDDAGHALLRETYARMSTALIEALGEPTEHVLEGVPRCGWVSEAGRTRLILTCKPPYVHLLLMEVAACHEAPA